MPPTRSLPLVRRDVSPLSVATVLALVLAVGAIEAMLFLGHVRYTLWSYAVLLVALSLIPLLADREVSVFQAFALLPVFRLVNLTMPVFVEATLFWLPLVYGPLVPAFVYLGRRASVTGSAWLPSGVRSTPETAGIGHGLPGWLGGNRGGTLQATVRGAWRSLAVPEDASTARSILQWGARGLLVVGLLLGAVAGLAVAVGVTVLLAEVEFGIITPEPLVPTLGFSDLALVAITMIGFVGLVEELLFRGVLQQVLERRYGVAPGLLLASATFAFMHSGYGTPLEIGFAFGVGLLFGIVYDVTDSLVLVAGMHGLSNVFVYGIIPLNGGSSVDLLYAVVLRELRRVGIDGVGIVGPLSCIDLGTLAGLL